MSQNDLTIANQGFASFRSDLNSALQALGSTNSGTSAPSTTFANQLFYDTTNNILKIRNEDNDAFISLFTLDQSNDNIESLTINGNLTADALIVDNITINGNELDASSSFTIDSGGDINFDAAGTDFNFKVDGTDLVRLDKSGDNTRFECLISDGDFIIRGSDAGTAIEALKLDMSDAGTAIFNHDIKIADNNNIQFGSGVDLILSSDGTHGTIENQQSNGDIFFKGSDAGSTITALQFDMSDKGTAIFNDRVAVANGTNSLPTFTFANDTNTGLYRPAADNLGFAIGGVARAFMSATQFSMSGNGVFSGSISKGSGSFKIDHPLESKKDTHHLVHSFVEAPQADNIYRGKVNLVDGSATVNLDTVSGMTEGTFILLNTNTQCFISNETGWTAVKGSVSNNILTITSEVSCTDSISWLVVGERHDQHMIDTEWTDDNGKVIVEPSKT